MIHKILGRLASVRLFVFATLALASFAASAFDTPYLTFRSASQFRLSGTSSRWSSGTLDIATSNPTDEASWTKGWTGTQVTAAQTDGQYYIYLRGTGITTFGGSSYYGSPFSLTWATTAADLYCEGDIETLRGYNGDVPPMGDYCYRYMFSGWSNLVAAPVLSATTLANNCYQGMFSSSQLMVPPALPAATLSTGCYNSMFSSCTSLKAIPALPATGSLPGSCYFGMFSGCTSLEVNTAGPGAEWSIPAGTTGASIWNYDMFANTGGDFTGNPVAGTTYYVASALPPGLRLETAEVHVYTGESMHIDLADTIAGGTGEYTFTDTASALSALGLSLSGNTLSGTISTAGNYNFTLHVADTTSPDPLTLDAEYKLVVTDPDPLAATANLGVAKIGKTVNIALADTISGGVPPYTFAVTADETLPVGFSLTDGVLSGAASAVGTLTFKITAKDALETSLPVSYTLEAVESTGFSDDDPEEPETGDPVDCLTPDGVFPRTCNPVTDSSTTVTWDNSWYYVAPNATITLSAGAIVSGKVSLILGDGATLTIQSTIYNAGIKVAEGSTLTIYAQSNGAAAGVMTVTGGMYGAGIGGSQETNSGTVNIYGGSITTTGGSRGAGIGGGKTANNGKVMIAGGVVNANGGFGGAGIGGGESGNGGVINIDGGDVHATGGYNSAGIGGGQNGTGGDVTVTGGSVSAIGYTNCPGVGAYSSYSQGELTVGANVVVKAGASSTPTDIKNPNGETSISLATKYQYYLIEKQGPVALAQTTSAFAAHVGQAFEQLIAGTVSGGTSPYTFTLKSQTLSDKGLAYENGVISGTPTATGSATVTVTVSDSATGSDHQSKDFTYTVTVTYPPKSITYVDSRDGTTELTGLVPAQYTPGTAATLPATATAPTGYAFAGWYATKKCTGDAVTSVATTETEDKTYYAKWTPILYTITYRDGASTMSGLVPTTYTIESTDITIPTPATKTGYEFVSWHTSSLLTPASMVTTIPHGSTGNKIFYSKWSLVPVNAPYKDGNGNTAYVSSTPLETTSTSLSTGWYIATGSITIPSTVTVSGDVKLILEDGCSLTVNGSSSKAGINVPPGTSLTIYAQANGTGSLTATAGSDGAGIGGNSGAACGSVTIYGGNVTAQTTSQYGAGIGGGKNGNGGTVTIYGGTVIARAQYSIAYGAGIGGGGATSLNTGNGGTVMIYGGTVTAESYRGAGIGGGNYNSGATVTINGGTVTATSSSGGAGIGGGYNGSGDAVTINGGTVTATGGSSTSSTAGYIASGIGKGYGSASSYTDGTLNVGVGMKAYVGSSANPTDELGSSRSYRYYVVKAGPLTQSVSAIKASSGEACNIDLAATVLGGSGTYTFALKAGSELPSGLEIDGTTLSGTVSSVGGYTFTLVVTDTTEPTPQTIDAEYTLTVKLPGFIDEDPEEPTSGDTVSVDCRNADGVVRKRTCHPVASSSTAVTWENSWYYVTGDVTLSAGVTVVGKVSLVLADGATLTVVGTTSNAGINVADGNSFVIYGQSEGTGVLSASSGTTSSYKAAGIGGNQNKPGGTVVICGGNITARGGYQGAGIGGGYSGSGGTVTIYGGTVTAIGGYNGAGIGGGQYGNNGGMLTIHSGTITATGGTNGAGIGGGSSGAGGTVTIYDGTIVANGGTNGAGIGGGNSGAGGRVDVYGGNIEATGGGSGSYTVGIGRGNGSSKTNGAGLYVYNDDAVIKYSSNASYTLNPITPNATTHKVDLGTSSSYKYVRITGPIPMAQKTTSLEAALTGQLKSWTLATSTYSSYIRDGKMPYTFDPENSTLPEGFSLTAAGVISGRPSAAGNYEFNIAVTDSNPSSTNFTFTLTVTDPAPITVSTTDYGSITKGTSFYHTIQPTGGVSPYTFSAVQAELPPGITCYTEAGVGVLSGTCNTPGDYEFTVTVTDAALPANVQPIPFHLEIKDVYPITYYDEGGVETLSLNPATYVQDAGLATLPTPVKEGSAFVNWYDNANLYGAPVTSIPATSTGPVALYSKWYTPVSGNIEVTFYGADGEQTETCTVIEPGMAAYDSSIHGNSTSSSMTLSSGWYVVANIDTLPENTSIVIDGEVNIVLMDDRSLTLPKPAYHKSGNYMSAMVVTSGNTLNIYGQTKGTGTLTATGFNSAAGIGGWGYYDNKACGTVKIYGGTVNAVGGSGAAGIGGSASADGAGGTVEIRGGTVTATGSNGGAGIGSGGNLLSSGVAADGGTVKIYGGTVTATGSAFSYSGPRVGAGAGIGGGGGAGQGGSGGTVEIYGGNVTAIGGVNESVSAAGIGGGNGASSQGTLKVSGEYAVVYAGDDAESATEQTPDANDMVALDGSPYYEIQGEGAAPVTYSITYMSAGVEQTWLEPNQYTHGFAQELATPDPREGYIFVGWFDNDQCLGDPVSEISASDSGDKILYAGWTPVVYTITYYSVVGDETTELTELAPATYTIESGATLPMEISVVREGWVFDGWASYTSGPQVTGIEPGTTGDKTFYVRWDVADFGLFDDEIYLDACFEDEVDLADTIHKGTAPYTFALKDIEDNELPNGLTLESDGTLSGTPTAAGIYDVVITVTDSSEPKRTIDATYTIEVMLSKTTGISGADATVSIGFPVEIDLASAIRGGTAPYSFELMTDWEGHGLPSGLVLNGNKLEGTPTFWGTSIFALNVTDANNYSSYLYYTIYSQSDTAQRTDTVNGIEWGYVSSSLPKQAGRLSIWNSSSLASDGMHAISANTEGCVYVPDGRCLWTGREPVTCIGRNAFKNCDKITRMTLPDTITDIGENAFDGCTALKAVVIPSSGILEHINTNAFAGATALERIYVCKGDKASFTALLEASGYAVPNENFILECDFYKLTLDTNLGDELDMPVLTKAYTETIYLPNVGNLPVPTRNNYTFDGWYTEKFGGIRINEDDTLSGGDWTLYAHWTTTMPDPVFTIDGNGVLTDVTLNGHTEIAIPDTVTSIGDRAFDGLRVSANKNLLRVVIPGTVENIGWRAFDECTKLREINIPSGVTNIAQNAFRLCVSLKSVDIPGSVETIGSSAFANCSNLVSVTIGNGVKTIGQSAFGYCTSLSCADEEVGFYIPDSVVSIGSGAFHGVRFEKASLPGTLYSEGDPVSAQFSNVSTLTKITVTYRDLAIPVFKIINGSLRSVQLNGNTEITIPDGVTEIFIDAFSGLSEMTSVTIPTTVTNIWANAFEGCSGLTEIEIPNSVTTLNRPFSGCTGLKNLTIPDSVTTLDLWNCDSLENVVVGSGVTEIAERAFSGCASLKSVTFLGDVTSIGKSAFWHCSSLKEINLPSSLRYIGMFAFYDCTSLETVTIPKFVEIAEWAFDGCTALKSALIAVEPPKSRKRLLVTSPKKAFLAASPETTTLGNRAFYGCKNLAEVTLGATVSEIGGGAFGGCPKLKSITIEAGNENWTSANGMLLKGGTELVSAFGTESSVSVPATVTVIDDGAFADYATLKNVTLPSGVTTIGEAAFSNATQLATITIPSTVTSIGANAFYGVPLATVCVSSGDGSRMSGLVSGKGYTTQSVNYFDAAAEVDASGMAAAELIETADNGLQKWQNYVLGQDDSEPVKVASVQGESVESVTIASSFGTPATGSGFTVEYQIDAVDANGAVVAAGTPQGSASFTLDLTQVKSNALFKVKATMKKEGVEVPVETENTIGVLVVTNAPATAIIGVPFKSLSDDGGISVDNLVQTANLTAGDKLKAYDTDGNLQAWTLNANKQWEADIVVGGGTSAQSADANTIKLDRGKGVWLTRQNPETPIYLVGAASADSVKTKLDTPVAEGAQAWNLVAPPSLEPVNVATLLDGREDTDKVLVPTAGAPKNFEYSNGQWGYWDYVDDGKGGVNAVFVTDKPELPPGTGFWYLNGDANASELNWDK